MEVHVGRNVSNFTPINCYFISQHARGRDFDRIGPVVVIVAKSICEIENCIFRNLRGIGGNVEMSWFDSSLSY